MPVSKPIVTNDRLTKMLKENPWPWSECHEGFVVSAKGIMVGPEDVLELLDIASHLDGALVRQSTRELQLLQEIIQLKSQLAAKDAEIESMQRGLDGCKSADQSVRIPPPDITPDVSLLPGDYVRPLAHVQTPISVHTLDKSLAEAMTKISDLEFNSSKHTSLIGNMRTAHESLVETVRRLTNDVAVANTIASEARDTVNELRGHIADMVCDYKIAKDKANVERLQQNLKPKKRKKKS